MHDETPIQLLARILAPNYRPTVTRVVYDDDPDVPNPKTITVYL